MPKFSYCESCGRKSARNYNTYIDHEKRVLCEFCAERERKLREERMANEVRGYRLHYCKRCGLKISNRAYEKFNGYCSTCFEFLFPKLGEIMKRCVVCGSEFVAFRKDTKFCSDKCRSLAYYRSQKRECPYFGDVKL